MALVVCSTLLTPLGAGGHVDWVVFVLRGLSPAALTALTTYWYVAPPDSPLIVVALLAVVATRVSMTMLSLVGDRK
jgi:hypothetical protein